ncbi:hypothetical protein [Thermococcus sp. 9N3]|uniref:hypothetical protein n=1 Tax=Thermococcus sp. 9N3 TaxID=163002 RepID=UPI00142F6640|nr:hypothetical protein [Thermococcus sp. 9N3]NJE48603.1 hypothetical protein [Thermococcus sp. 9N3]
MAVEIEVSGEELDRIRRNRKEIENRFRDAEGLERTLKALKLRLLLERRERLLRKLEEMETNYRELVEFEKKAKEDRSYMLELRSELSRENAELRKRLGDMR